MQTQSPESPNGPSSRIDVRWLVPLILMAVILAAILYHVLPTDEQAVIATAAAIATQSAIETATALAAATATQFSVETATAQAAATATQFSVETATAQAAATATQFSIETATAQAAATATQSSIETATAQAAATAVQSVTETATAQAAATPTATATPPPTVIPTSTATATPTPTPLLPTATSTATATLTPTVMPILTDTPVPTAAPPRRWLPAPQLLAPTDGTAFNGWNAKVILQWSAVPGLLANEYYVVRIPYDEDGNVAEFWRKETSFQVPSHFSSNNYGFPDRHYDWTVQVMRCTVSCDQNQIDDDNVRKQSVKVGAQLEGQFYWYPDLGGGPAPTVPSHDLQ